MSKDTLGAPLLADLPKAPGEISGLGMQSQHTLVDIVSHTEPIHHFPLQNVNSPLDHELSTRDTCTTRGDGGHIDHITMLTGFSGYVLQYMITTSA